MQSERLLIQLRATNNNLTWRFAMPRWLLLTALIFTLAGCEPAARTTTDGADDKAEDDDVSGDKLVPAKWLAGVDTSSELHEELSTFEKEWQEKPEVTEKRLVQLSVHNNLGKYFLSEDNAKQAHVCWLSAGKLADKLAPKKDELEFEQRPLLGSAYYNAACARSQAGEQDEALALLNKAVAWGYSSLDHVEKDKDLEPLRKAHDFSKFLPEWEKTATAVGKEHAEHLLKDAKSFAFDFDATDLDGEKHKLADYEGSVLTVDIWGTWCPPCRMEIPHFVKLVKEQGPEGFKMLGLNYREDSEDDVKEFAQKFGINYPCSLQKGEPENVPHFEGFPTTIFIDRQGKVRLKVVGYHDYYVLKGVVTTLLAEK